LLQPVVENCLKHGLAPKIEGGRIQLRTKNHDGRLHIEIEDNGVGISEEKMPHVWMLPDPPPPTEGIGLEAIHQELSKYRYCTVFLIEGKELDREALESELEQLGDSLLVVGDPGAIKVHVHTDDPGAALTIGTRVGTIGRIEIANMHEQTAEREERLRAAVCDAAPSRTTMTSYSRI
jgi:hypothetical protein